MPTFDVTDTFQRDLDDLTALQLDQFSDAVAKFVDDLLAIETDPRNSIRAGLRVKPYRGSSQGVMEMTWANDGRALFLYGDAVIAGKRHVRWLRIGTHDIF